ncbi:MAG: TfoX/Sxy family protein [Salinarimonas sp.]
MLAGFAPVTIRRMFGGHGVFHDGLMFALEADGELFLKANDASEPAFLEVGSQPFVYAMKGRRVTMRYWRAPAAALDDPEIMAVWAREAYRAARESAREKAPKRKTSRNAVAP